VSAEAPVARYEIRAMTVAEILDTAFQLLRDRFLLLLALSLVAYLPSLLLFALFPALFDPFAPAPGPEEVQQMLRPLAVAGGLFALGFALTFPFVQAAITAAVGRLYVGEPVSLGHAARDGLARYLPLVATYVLLFVGLGLIAGVLMALVLGVFSGLSGTTGGVIVQVLAGILGLALLVVLGVNANLLVAIVPEVVVLERRSLLSALIRSVELLTGARWRALGVVLCAALLAGVVSGGVQLFAGLVPVVGLLLWGAAQALGYAFGVAASVVLYFDIRCRKEAFDVEHLARLVERRGPGTASGAPPGP